jgi:Beta-lactamase
MSTASTRRHFVPASQGPNCAMASFPAVAWSPGLLAWYVIARQPVSYEQGKLSLHDDVRKYLPELPDYGTPINIRHLLHHTSGLREPHYLAELAGWRWDDVVTEEMPSTSWSGKRS